MKLHRKLTLALALALPVSVSAVVVTPIAAQAAGNNWLLLEKGGTCGVNISPNYPKPNWYYKHLPPNGYSPDFMPNVRAFWVHPNCTVFDIGRSRSYKTNYWHQLPDGAGLGYYLRVKAKV